MRLPQTMTFCATLALTACAPAMTGEAVPTRNAVPAPDAADPWYRAGESTLQAALARNVSDAPAAQRHHLHRRRHESLHRDTAARSSEGQPVASPAKRMR